MPLSCYVPSQIIPKSRIVQIADKQILKRHILSYPKIIVSKNPAGWGGGWGGGSIRSPWTILNVLRAMTLSFLSFLFFDWVGILWPQLSKVLKLVRWARMFITSIRVNLYIRPYIFVCAFLSCVCISLARRFTDRTAEPSHKAWYWNHGLR